jgi:hypothetical protein
VPHGRFLFVVSENLTKVSKLRTSTISIWQIEISKKKLQLRFEKV